MINFDGNEAKLLYIAIQYVVKLYALVLETGLNL